MERDWRVPPTVARSLGGVMLVTAVFVWGAVTLLQASEGGGWTVSQSWIVVALLTGALVASDALGLERRSFAQRLTSGGVLVIWASGVISLVQAVAGQVPGAIHLDLIGSGYLLGAAGLAVGLALQAAHVRRPPTPAELEEPAREPEEPLVAALRSALKEARLSDPLTGLTTLYGLEEQGIPTAYGRAVTVIFNLDDLGWINRRFGRKAGDHVMRQAAEALSGALFSRACLARLGGDEFLAVSPGGRPEALALVREGRKALKTLALTPGGMEEMSLACSVGIAPVGEQRTSAFAEALAVAEMAVDEAQLRGGDRIVWAEKDLSPEQFLELDHDRATLG